MEVVGDYRFLLSFFFFDRIVEFVFYFDMKNVVSKLDGIEINGRKIKLVEDKLKRSSRRRRYCRN